MKTIRVLLLSLSVAVGSPPVLGRDEAEVPKPGEVAVPAGQRLELMNCDAKMYGEFYARFSGKSVSVSPNLRVLKSSLMVHGPLSNGDAARFIENQLLLEGCVIREDGPGAVTIAMGARAWKMPPKDEKKIPGKIWGPRPDAIAVPRGGFFDWKRLDVSTAVYLYYKHTGKRVLVPSILATIEMGILKEGPLTNAEAAKLLEDALGAEGLVLKEFTPGEVAVLPINQVVVKEQLSKPPSPRPVRVRRVP